MYSKVFRIEFLLSEVPFLKYRNFQNVCDFTVTLPFVNDNISFWYRQLDNRFIAFAWYQFVKILVSNSGKSISDSDAQSGEHLSRVKFICEFCQTKFTSLLNPILSLSI